MAETKSKEVPEMNIKKRRELAEEHGELLYALRYSSNIQRDLRRGYSIAGWGCAPQATKAECKEEYPGMKTRYIGELGGWLPIEKGLCAVVTAETEEEALEELEYAPSLPGFDEGLAPLWIFPCRVVGHDGEGWELVQPLGTAKRIK